MHLVVGGVFRMTPERELRVILSTITMAINRPVMKGRIVALRALKDAAEAVNNAVGAEQHKASTEGGEAA